MQHRYTTPTKFLAALLALTVFGSSPFIASADTTKTAAIVEQGEQIYGKGLLISGQPLKAKTQGNTEVSGQHLACISCHRRSGLGSYEGKVQIPPIAGRALLTAPSAVSPQPLAQTTKGYTEASLKQAIQSGITPDGRVLNSLMPHYELGGQDSDALIAYLKTLSASDSPGVDALSMHFATVVSKDIPAKRRKIMLGLIQKYFPLAVPASPKKKPLIQTPQSRAALFQNMRRQRVPNYFPARKLELHVWELKGPHSSWGKQLENYYRKQPVFAIIGGLAEGPWSPVHEFCEHHEAPCLFPNTVQPVVDEHDFYNVYFTKGLSVEGETVAKHIGQAGEPHGKILQVFRRGDSAAEQAAAGLREEASELKLGQVSERAITLRGSPTPDYWKQLLKKEQPEHLVLWLKPADLKSLKAIATTSAGLKRLYLSATLMGTISPSLPEKLQPLTYLTHRYLVPDTPAYKQIDNFMQSHAIDGKQNPDDRWLIGDTEWAMNLLSEAVRQMKYNSRELLVETVEMLVSRKPPLLYPRLGLAADQRFASKGCFVVPLNKPTQAVWIVPD